MRHWRIKGSTYTVGAPCVREAIRKLVCDDDELAGYTRHWYTRTNRLSWAEVRTTYGYNCIIEEVQKDDGWGKEGGTIKCVEKFVSAGGRRCRYTVYYANAKGTGFVRYDQNDNLPITVTEFLTSDKVRCETTYTNTGRVEVTTPIIS